MFLSTLLTIYRHKNVYVNTDNVIVNFSDVLSSFIYEVIKAWTQCRRFKRRFLYTDVGFSTSVPFCRSFWRFICTDDVQFDDSDVFVDTDDVSTDVNQFHFVCNLRRLNFDMVWEKEKPLT